MDMDIDLHDEEAVSPRTAGNHENIQLGQVHIKWFRPNITSLNIMKVILKMLMKEKAQMLPLKKWRKKKKNQLDAVDSLD